MFPQFFFTNLAQFVVTESQLHAESILILSLVDAINCLLLISLLPWFCHYGYERHSNYLDREADDQRQHQKKQVLMSANHPRSQQDPRQRPRRI